MSIIETKHGTYEYEDVKFVLNSKIINREISRDNLLILKKCFDRHNLTFGLAYGTLLGAIRENNFIAHDEDTDIFILAENQEKLLDLLFELRKFGLEVGRFNDSLISLIRNGEYIDVYFFSKSNFGYRKCEGLVIKSEFLENLEEIEFLGERFKVPKNSEKLLEILYGKNWKIPDKNGKPINFGLYLTIKNFIKNNSKNTFNVLSWIKKNISNILIYLKFNMLFFGIKEYLEYLN